MNLAELEPGLRRRLAGRLPGAVAQERMAPRPRRGWQLGFVPPDSRPGAALLLLYSRSERAHLVLTLRDANLPHHAGQVSLPGGGVEAGESFSQTALREAEEEIGLDTDHVRVWGPLSPMHVPASGFTIRQTRGVLGRTRWPTSLAVLLSGGGSCYLDHCPLD